VFVGGYAADEHPKHLFIPNSRYTGKSQANKMQEEMSHER
jgi:hypothetical protein